MLYGELMSAAGFHRDHLYLEYVITYDPQIWSLEEVGGEPPDKPGVIKVSGLVGALYSICCRCNMSGSHQNHAVYGIPEGALWRTNQLRCCLIDQIYYQCTEDGSAGQIDHAERFYGLCTVGPSL